MPDQPAPNLEEARRIAVNHRHNDWALGAVSRAYLALLSEREAREELREALEQACDDMAVMIAETASSLGNLQAEANLRHYRSVLAALPAPESAQAEQPTSEAGS